jgi:uncharacterized protein
MNSALFQFNGILEDFLTLEQRGTTLRARFEQPPSVKHLVEAFGVPHTEVACILVNDAPVDFSYLVKDGDRVIIFPPQIELPCTQKQLLGQYRGELHFILDNHLGRLAVYLRMLGLDTLYRNDYQDEELSLVASQEERILLTRDRRLLMRSAVTYGYWVRATDPRLQILEITRRFRIDAQIQPFRRCLKCNGLLQPVSKEAVLERLEPLTQHYYDEFRLCPDCGRVYWRGSHYEHMKGLIAEIKAAGAMDGTAAEDK